MTIDEAVATGNDINSSVKLYHCHNPRHLRYYHVHHHTCYYHYLIILKDSYGKSFQFFTRLVHHFPATSLGASIAPPPSTMHTLMIYRDLFCLICGVQREDLDMFQKKWHAVCFEHI